MEEIKARKSARPRRVSDTNSRSSSGMSEGSDVGSGVGMKSGSTAGGPRRKSSTIDLSSLAMGGKKKKRVKGRGSSAGSNASSLLSVDEDGANSDASCATGFVSVCLGCYLPVCVHARVCVCTHACACGCLLPVCLVV